MDNKETIEHTCLQERRITRLEDKSDQLDTKIDKIMDILADNKVTLGKILTRLNRKKETDKERDTEIKDEEKRLDRLEANDLARATQNKILLTLITTMLIAFIIFFIEFQYKTYILQI